MLRKKCVCGIIAYPRDKCPGCNRSHTSAETTTEEVTSDQDWKEYLVVNKQTIGE